jgi:hypothetical protein
MKQTMGTQKRNLLNHVPDDNVGGQKRPGRYPCLIHRRQRFIDTRQAPGDPLVRRYALIVRRPVCG